MGTCVEAFQDEEHNLREGHISFAREKLGPPFRCLQSEFRKNNVPRFTQDIAQD